MRGCAGAAGGQRRRGHGVGAVGRVPVLSRESGKGSGVRAQLRDLERGGGGEPELQLELEVSPRSVAFRVPGLSQSGEGGLPRLGVCGRELHHALLDGERLRCDARRVLPRVTRRARDHRYEPGREGDGERGRRPAAGRPPSLRELLEEYIQPQIEVVLGLQSRTSLRRTYTAAVPLYLTESDVAQLLRPDDAVEAIEACLRRMADGEVEIAPRRRLRMLEGSLADMAASDLGLGLAGGKLYAASAEGAAFVVCLFDAAKPELAAVIEADQLGRLRTGAASGVAARHLARSGARTLGVIGCGHQAETQVACIRAAVPAIDRVVAYCRTPERLTSFCERVGAELGGTHRDPGEQDVVVTITSARDPVLRGEWLRPGALVIAAGANVARSRELDNAVLERATFVCCDSLEQARLESGDLIEPIGAGVLDWLEVHELHEVVSGEVAGRQSDEDVVVFKSNGIAAWDVALGAEALRRARELGVGTPL